MLVIPFVDVCGGELASKRVVERGAPELLMMITMLMEEPIEDEADNDEDVG